MKENKPCAKCFCVERWGSANCGCLCHAPKLKMSLTPHKMPLPQNPPISKPFIAVEECQHTGTPKDIVGCKICHPQDKLNPPLKQEEKVHKTEKDVEAIKMLRNSLPPSEEEYDCQWENCSGGQYCEKHSLESRPSAEEECICQIYRDAGSPPTPYAWKCKAKTHISPPAETWEEEFREYFNKCLKPKRPTINGLDREMIIDFIHKRVSSARTEVLEEIIKEIEVYTVGTREKYKSGICTHVDGVLALLEQKKTK